MVLFLSALALRSPAAAPHAWQNRAPGESGVWHWLQLPAKAVPQWVQNLPAAGLPQLGQFESDDWLMADPSMLR
jgi:hypothetical protein